jgi:hypothetical protein
MDQTFFYYHTVYIYIYLKKIVLNIFFEEIGLSLSRGVTVAPNASKWPG